MLDIMHHVDDGIEAEYFAIYETEVPGNSIIESFETEEEALKVLKEMEEDYHD